MSAIAMDPTALRNKVFCEPDEPAPGDAAHVDDERAVVVRRCPPPGAIQRANRAALSG